MLQTDHRRRGAWPAGPMALFAVVALISGCGSSAHRSASTGTSGSASGQVQIKYDGQIGQGSAPGHAKFVATGAIADTGTVVIQGRRSSGIVYTKLILKGKKGTFRVSEKIIIGGAHTWTLTSGTGAYGGLHGTGSEAGAPDASGQIHVLMTGGVAL